MGVEEEALRVEEVVQVFYRMVVRQIVHPELKGKLFSMDLSVVSVTVKMLMAVLVEAGEEMDRTTNLEVAEVVSLVVVVEQKTTAEAEAVPFPMDQILTPRKI